MKNVLVTLVILALTLPNSFQYDACYFAKFAALKLLAQTECPIYCTKLYQPVWGFNPCGQTPEDRFRLFGNNCTLRSTVCEGPGNLYFYAYDA